MTLAPLTICELYRSRWQVELFFKWIKQHLRIKRFFGTSENAVKTQVWIAVAVYVLVAIVRKRLNLELSLHEMLQILSITPFDKITYDSAPYLLCNQRKRLPRSQSTDFTVKRVGRFCYSAKSDYRANTVVRLFSSRIPHSSSFYFKYQCHPRTSVDRFFCLITFLRSQLLKTYSSNAQDSPYLISSNLQPYSLVTF